MRQQTKGTEACSQNNRMEGSPKAEKFDQPGSPSLSVVIHQGREASGYSDQSPEKSSFCGFDEFHSSAEGGVKAGRGLAVRDETQDHPA